MSHHLGYDILATVTDGHSHYAITIQLFSKIYFFTFSDWLSRWWWEFFFDFFNNFFSCFNFFLYFFFSFKLNFFDSLSNLLYLFFNFGCDFFRSGFNLFFSGFFTIFGSFLSSTCCLFNDRFQLLLKNNGIFLATYTF